MHQSKDFGECQSVCSSHENDRMSRVTYALDIGSIIYAMRCVCSDISDVLGIIIFY